MNQNYGQLDGMDDTQLAGGEAMKLAGAAQPRQDGDTITLENQGNILWSYQNEGRIYGVPVVPEHRGLKIDTDDAVTSYFELVRRPRSMILLMNTDTPDAQAKYDELLDAVYDGRAEIVEETRQFDSAKSAFLVWISYNELCFKLNPRFHYLLEE